MFWIKKQNTVVRHEGGPWNFDKTIIHGLLDRYTLDGNQPVFFWFF